MANYAQNPYPEVPNPPPGGANPAPVYSAYNGPANPPVYGGLQAQGGYPAYPAAGYVPMQGIPVQGNNGYYPLPQNQAIIYPGQPVAPVIVNRKFAYLYLASAFVTVALSFTTLLLPTWIKFCSFDVGLDQYDGHGSSGSLSSGVSSYCDYLGGEIDCVHVCSNFDRLRSAAGIMSAFGYPSVLSLALSELRMLLLMVRPNRLCGAVMIRLTLVLSTLAWVAGVCFYIAYYSKVKDDNEDTSVETGLALAIVALVLQVANCVLGNYAVSKMRR